MKNSPVVLFIIVGFAVIGFLIIWLIGGLAGAVKDGDGCLLRYSMDEDGTIDMGSSSKISSYLLRADGNYTPSKDSKNELKPDDNSYAKWLDTKLAVSANNKMGVKVTGEVSLCLAYLPENNVQSKYNTVTRMMSKKYKQAIPIPRVGQGVLDLIVNAKENDKWGNLVELETDDLYLFTIKHDRKAKTNLVSQYDAIRDQDISRYCLEGSKSYDPICGRFAIHTDSIKYAKGCNYGDGKKWCESKLCKGKPAGTTFCEICSTICTEKCDLKVGFLGTYHCCDEDSSTIPCLIKRPWPKIKCKEKEVCLPVLSSGPVPYTFDGTHVFHWSEELKFEINNAYRCDKEKNCGEESSFDNYTKNLKYWFSANNAAGLLYRFSNDANPKGQKIGDYEVAKIINDEEQEIDVDISGSDAEYKVLLYGKADQGSYLQARLYATDGGSNESNDGYKTNTGGYVLGVSQTKCIRRNGSALDGIGAVQYVILPNGKNPNDMKEEELEKETFILNSDGETSLTPEKDGYIWLRIDNRLEEFGDRYYRESEGNYEVAFFSSVKFESFLHKILNPIIDMFKNEIIGASKVIFAKMVCYGESKSQEHCTNLFNYIRGMLILYVSWYGIMIAIGATQLNQTDIVIRLIKIAIIGGLINEKTFVFFNTYIFDLITNFTDTVISNMSGYDLLDPSKSSHKISFANPLAFTDELLTKAFTSPTFMAQMLALFSIGISGVFYFIFVVAALVVAVISTMRAIVIYIMAFLAVAILISVAPIFLTFLLFQRTKYLFDNWAKFIFFYLIEPVILMAGFVILIQLFTVYLDYATGYSVCWRCAIPIKIPFVADIGLDFLNVPIFCINWFIPWGVEKNVGVGMQFVISLLILSYCMLGYIEFSSKIAISISGGGPVALGNMARGFSNWVEQGVLKKAGLDAKSMNIAKSKMKQRIQARMERDKADKKDIKKKSKKDGKDDDSGGDGNDRKDGNKGDKDNDGKDNDKDNVDDKGVSTSVTDSDS